VTDRPALDPDELLGRATAAVAAQGHPDAALIELEPLPGGISSLTYAATLLRGGQRQRAVVKVAPPGLAPVRNRDVLRQARILRALHGTPGVSVPRVLGEQDGSPPLFVMEFVAGESYEPKWDAAAQPPPAESIAPRVRAAATMLAHMHRPSADALGLADEPVLSPRRELDRWAQLFQTVGDELRGDEQTLYRALTERMPEPLTARVTHGDYRLGNLQFSGTEVRAIIDWELWALGDPRADLAWLAMFCDPVMERATNRDQANEAASAAMPAPQAVLETYERIRPGHSDELGWFLAAAYYKLGSALAALAKRNRRAGGPDPTLERAAQTLPPTIQRGLELLDR
jgi:aminoglycoside phosphotransferase (APT) family kinase protein